MYECPIELLVSPMQAVTEQAVKEMTKEIENNQMDLILTAVQKCGVSINRDELIKLIQGDRHSYERGYADGKLAAGLTWTKCSEGLPPQGQRVLVWIKDWIEDIDTWASGRYLKDFWVVGDDLLDDTVIAWAEVPMPPLD